MDRPSEDPRNVKLALLFLKERAGMDVESIGRAIGAPPALVSMAFDEGAVAWTGPQLSSIDAIIATQSILLDGYTPESAALWMTSPSNDLGGAVPVDRMTGPDGAVGVLRAAAARMSR